MKCIYCHHNETKVLDKRDLEEQIASRRRRQCLKCQKRFTTYERVEAIDLKVSKKDGTIQPYDREKFRRSLLIAARQRLSEEEVDVLVDDIETTILNRKSGIISTGDLGRLILTKLKSKDSVSYLRFASVFLDFENIESFKQEIKKLESIKV